MAKRSCKTCGKRFTGDGRRRYCDKHTPKPRPKRGTRPTHLRAVEPDEAPARKVTTIAEAAESGSTLDELRMMRMRIARTLDDPNCPPRDLASLSRRQIELGREIDAILARQREETEGGEGVEDEAFDAEAI